MCIYIIFYLLNMMNVSLIPSPFFRGPPFQRVPGEIGGFYLDKLTARQGVLGLICLSQAEEAFFKGQLGVPLTVYPLYFLCSLGILGDYHP